MSEVIICVGSRPDIIKMWPIYSSLKESYGITPKLIFSHQQTDIAYDALNVFNLAPYKIFRIQDEQRMNMSLMYSVLINKFSKTFETEITGPSKLVVVHGDVITALAAATAAFFLKIPVVHVEAGLRTSKYETPHPEEGIRRMISRIARFHFAPTDDSRENLLRENIPSDWIEVTGNTVVDSLLHLLSRKPMKNLDHLDEDYVLITCHRRESFGEPLRELCKTLNQSARTYPELKFYWPLHPNSHVKSAVEENGPYASNLIFSKALSYDQFVHYVKEARLIITDSGGVIEEASVLNIPLIILRTVMERPESLSLSQTNLVGYNFELMKKCLHRYITDPPAKLPHVTGIFGDGTSGEKIASSIVRFIGMGI